MKDTAYALLAEEVVDVVVGDLGEGRTRAGTRDLLQQRIEDLVELVGSLLHPQPDQAQGAAAVEDDDQDHPAADHRDVQVVALSLVEEDGELLLSDQLGEAAGR